MSAHLGGIWSVSDSGILGISGRRLRCIRAVSPVDPGCIPAQFEGCWSDGGHRPAGRLVAGAGPLATCSRIRDFLRALSTAGALSALRQQELAGSRLTRPAHCSHGHSALPQTLPLMLEFATWQEDEKHPKAGP